MIINYEEKCCYLIVSISGKQKNEDDAEFEPSLGRQKLAPQIQFKVAMNTGFVLDRNIDIKTNLIMQQIWPNRVDSP